MEKNTASFSTGERNGNAVVWNLPFINWGFEPVGLVAKHPLRHAFITQIIQATSTDWLFGRVFPL
ncbi:Uncharacterised protein [Providencia rustigianii]|nr:Uncharacterised protein [Providencia rustigianii]